MNLAQKYNENESTMIKLQTRSLDIVDVNPETFLSFQEGLFGFGSYKEFVIIPDPGEFPFEWLQSTESPDLAFILIAPNEVFSQKYEPVVALADLNQLNIKSIKECKIYTIVTIPQKSPQDMTANYQGPILVNESLKAGRQIISLDEDHKLRVRVLDLLES